MEKKQRSFTMPHFTAEHPKLLMVHRGLRTANIGCLPKMNMDHNNMLIFSSLLQDFMVSMYSQVC